MNTNKKIMVDPRYQCMVALERVYNDHHYKLSRQEVGGLGTLILDDFIKMSDTWHVLRIVLQEQYGTSFQVPDHNIARYLELK